MTTDKDKLIGILEQDPELYKLINSKPHISILKEISLKPIDFEQLKKKIYFKRISILYNILNTLIDKKLVNKLDINNKDMYYITDKGTKFIQLCKITEKEFNLS